MRPSAVGLDRKQELGCFDLLWRPTSHVKALHRGYDDRKAGLKISPVTYDADSAWPLNHFKAILELKTVKNKDQGHAESSMSAVAKCIEQLEGAIAALEVQVAESKPMQAQSEGGLLGNHKTIDIALQYIAEMKTFVANLKLLMETNDAKRLQELVAANEEVCHRATRLLACPKQ